MGYLNFIKHYKALYTPASELYVECINNDIIDYTPAMTGDVGENVIAEQVSKFTTGQGLVVGQVYKVNADYGLCYGLEGVLGVHEKTRFKHAWETNT